MYLFSLKLKFNLNSNGWIGSKKLLPEKGVCIGVSVDSDHTGGVYVCDILGSRPSFDLVLILPYLYF